VYVTEPETYSAATPAPNAGTIITGSTGSTGSTGADGALTAWGRTGNAGTVAGTNFIGTTDAVGLRVKTNSIDRWGFSAFTSKLTNYDVLSNYFIGGGNDVATGTFNVGIASDALAGVSTGELNIAIGDQSLSATTSGGVNVGIGSSALADNLTGSGNIGIGASALVGDGTGTANENTAIGNFAGQNVSLAIGDSNTFLGSHTTADLAGITNATAVGANVTLSQSNTIGLVVIE